MGQKVYTEKTSLFFSRNSPGKVKDDIKSSLGVHDIKQHDKCLGLSSFLGRSKKQTFTDIKARLWNKVRD